MPSTRPRSGGGLSGRGGSCLHGALACLALAGAVLLPSAHAADDCFECHASTVSADRFEASAHGALGCAACHTDVDGFPHPEQVAKPACASCHADAVTALGASVHRGADGARCADCHGDAHRVLRGTERASPVHWSNVAGTCAHCHADPQMAQRFRIPTVRPIESYLESVHARAVVAGKRAAVCTDCHGAHDVVSGADPASPLARAVVGATCGKCHTAELAAYRTSVHGAALGRGVRDTPACTDCHGEHRILARTDPASPIAAANVPRDTCGPCHASARLSERYGLPGGRVASFQDSFHGLALRAGQRTVANCASCHGVHDILPSSDLASHVHPANLAKTCAKCHPGAGTGVSLGPVHFETTADGAPAVYWIRFAYLWLIGLVVGAMAVHNGLDLLHKARRPVTPPRGVPLDVPVRMPRVLRWQHGLVMLSFAMLVYTGFALTYPESWWAAPLLRFETRLGLRGRLHRLAALVLLGSLAWHLGELALSPRRRACLAGLHPAWRDVRDVIATLAAYLGRRPLPGPHGRFSYVEKAEYWAFVWGMAIMTVTGLVLWFENAALRWLPKWASDAATAVHFYEAILATLAILVWHLYWVVFDPDVYPMDASWWHGRAPAARVHERSEEDGDAG